MVAGKGDALDENWSHSLHRPGGCQDGSIGARTKEEERQNDQTIPPDAPIEPESGKLIDQTATVIGKASRIFHFVVALFLLAAVAYLFFVDSITRWIIPGTAALMTLIIRVHRRMNARRSSASNTSDQGRTDLDRRR